MKMPQSCARYRKPLAWTPLLLTPMKEKCQQEIQARVLFSFSHGIKRRVWTVKRKYEWEIFWLPTCSEPPPSSLQATPGLQTGQLTGQGARGYNAITQAGSRGKATAALLTKKGFVRPSGHVTGLQDGLELLKWSRWVVVATIACSDHRAISLILTVASCWEHESKPTTWQSKLSDKDMPRRGWPLP